MTREEMNLIRGFVGNIQSLKDAHINDNLPINYGMLCTIVAKGWGLLRELEDLEQESCEDIISRQAVINIVEFECGEWSGLAKTIVKAIEQLSSVRLDYDANEWCHDCKEYNHEKHCCPRYNKIIKKTIEEIKELYIGTAEWVLLDECSNSGYYCSYCRKKLVKEGWSDTVKKIKYCPNCGRRMKMGNESKE
jgi:hypothetical protein